MTTKLNWREIPCPVPHCRAYICGAVRVIVGEEPQGWHISISCEYRYPTWEEIKSARYEFVPDEVTMAMLLPPKVEWVNIHENCFHLYQIPGEGETKLQISA